MDTNSIPPPSPKMTKGGGGGRERLLALLDGWRLDGSHPHETLGFVWMVLPNYRLYVIPMYAYDYECVYVMYRYDYMYMVYVLDESICVRIYG